MTGDPVRLKLGFPDGHYLESIAVAGAGTEITLKAQELAINLIEIYKFVLAKCENDQDRQDLKEVYKAAITAENIALELL